MAYLTISAENYITIKVNYSSKLKIKWSIINNYSNKKKNLENKRVS